MTNRSESQAARAAGFTLLEVLAAVALLGIVYTVLASIAVQGVGTEGETRRRLEASLLADERLADLESQLDAGAMPELGASESEEDPFRVELTVEAFDLDAALAGEPASSVPVAGSNEEDSPLRAVRVVVSWDEGENEHRVVRTTFGFDPVSAAGSALSGLAERP